MRLTYIISLFIVLFALYFLTSCIKDNETKDKIINYVQIGDFVPTFTVNDGEGKQFNSEMFKDKKSILVFFHTSCEDCQKVLPIIEEAWLQIKDSSEYQIIVIGREQSKVEIDNYWEKERFSMPTYLDIDRQVFNVFANSTIPRVYLIDTNGIIHWMAIEKLNISAHQLIEKLELLP